MYASQDEQHEDFIFDNKAVLVSSRDEKGKNPAETIKPPKKWNGLCLSYLTEPYKGRCRHVAAMPFSNFQS